MMIRPIAMALMVLGFAGHAMAGETPAQKRAVRVIDMSVDSPNKVLDVNKATPTLIATSADEQKSASRSTTR